MKRFVLISVGSRGDAEPFISLAKELSAAGQCGGSSAISEKEQQPFSVDLFLPQDLIPLTTTYTSNKQLFNVHALPFTTTDFYKYTAIDFDHPNPRVKFIKIVAEIIGELVLPCFDQVLDRVVQLQPDDDGTAKTNSSCTIVASSLARHLAMAVAARCVRQGTSCHVGLVHLQPLQPTAAFAHYSDAEKCIEGIVSTQNGDGADDKDTSSNHDVHLETYWEPERFQHDFLRERWAKYYSSTEEVPDFERDVKPMLLGMTDGTCIINAFSLELIPIACETTKHTWNVGPLADAYMDPDWPAPNDLVEFLKCHPICIGFGSMPCGQADSILSTLKELDCPAVLVGSCFVTALDQQTQEAKEKDVWIHKNVYAIAAAPYPWLLPQCRLMMSHGGAGVVNSVLRAGIPHIVAPFFGDQPFWAKLLAHKKIGMETSNMTTLTKQDIREAIAKAIDDIELQQNTKRLGIQIRDKEVTGVGLLADRLRQLDS